MANDVTPFQPYQMNTKNRHICETNYMLAVLCVLLALVAGCELEDDPADSVTIVPASALLTAKETNIIEFSAAGGNRNYKWSMNNNILGTLYIATTNSAIALYQNSTNTGTNLITVRDSSGASANARIIQKWQ